MTRDITYVLGHSEGELARLEQQASFYDDGTEQVLRRAGLAAGQRVLDLGCGAGDVSLIAARIVGSTGSVLGIDRAEEALGTARRRAAAAGSDWVRFHHADVTDLALDETFDAVIGRFIMMYLPDPSALLRSLTTRLAPGGVMAFVELDVPSTHMVPELPLYRQMIDLIVRVYEAAGIEPTMGSKLFAAFRGAGLQPKLYGTVRVEDTRHPKVPEFVVETLRSLLPMMERFGVADPAEVDIATLGERLAAEAERQERCVIFPRLIGAWAGRP